VVSIESLVGAVVPEVVVVGGSPELELDDAGSDAVPRSTVVEGDVEMLVTGDCVSLDSLDALGSPVPAEAPGSTFGPHPSTTAATPIQPQRIMGPG
jgi:hypothetical protein